MKLNRLKNEPFIEDVAIKGQSKIIKIILLKKKEGSNVHFFQSLQNSIFWENYQHHHQPVLWDKNNLYYDLILTFAKT